MSLVIHDLDIMDSEVIVSLACSLDESPNSNWVEKEGGLPEYICRIAKAIKRSGRPTSQAIAIAVSRVKKWAAGGDDVTVKTRAKAAAALAQWEKIKAKAKADNLVSASNSDHFELTFNEMMGMDHLSISDSALELAAQFEDCSSTSPLLKLSREYKDYVALSTLTTKKRKSLSDESFAIPEERKYPIYDEEHARNALARVAQFGTEEEKKRVRAAVKKKYPSISISGDDE